MSRGDVGRDKECCLGRTSRMDKYWEFSRIWTSLYVTDVESCEIVYMNRCARMAFGCPSPEDYQNKKCYQVLQNRTGPRSVRQSWLQRKNFYRWSYTNPRLKTHLRSKGHAGGAGRPHLPLGAGTIDMGVQGEAQSVEPESVPETPLSDLRAPQLF